MTAATAAPSPVRLPWALLLAVAAGAAVLFLPLPEGLPVAGHRMLAIFVFAIVAWITEAVTYEVSSIFIVGLMALLLLQVPSRCTARRAWGALAPASARTS
jgi:di/tricarboxylate transporter